MVVLNWSSGVTGFNELRKSLTKQIGAKFGYFFFNSQCAIKMRGKEREIESEKKGVSQLCCELKVVIIYTVDTVTHIYTIIIVL